MSQFHFTEHQFKNVFQADDSNFATISRDNHSESLAGALHAAQRDFETRAFLKKQRRSKIRGNRFGFVQFCAKEQFVDVN
jgi:hypothetical protein